MLTRFLGSASDELSDLFGAGTDTRVPRLALPRGNSPRIRQRWPRKARYPNRWRMTTGPGC
jgi:hypothetical protein